MTLNGLEPPENQKSSHTGLLKDIVMIFFIHKAIYKEIAYSVTEFMPQLSLMILFLGE